MRAALLDALTGRFGDGARVGDVPEGEQQLHSILGNLRRLFNARRGGLRHLPEYGLPDLSDVTASDADEVEGVRLAIRDAVQRFEPRLQQVRVQREPSPRDASHLVFLLSAELRPSGRVRFQTTIRASEPVEIRPRDLG